MKAKLPTMGEFIRRDIVHGEYLGALTELARPCPCDRCKLRERCATEKLACRAFVAFVHAPDREDCRRRSRKAPTRGLYEIAWSGDGAESVLARAGSSTLKPGKIIEAKAEFLGRVIAGREVVAVEVAGNPRTVSLRLHCPECGKDLVRAVWDARKGKLKPCRCVAAKQRGQARRAKAEAYRGKLLPNGWRCISVETQPSTRPSQRGMPVPTLVLQHEQTGIVRRCAASRVRNGRGPAPPSPHARTRAERAAERTAAAAVDARFLDPSSWKPCEP